MHNKPPSRDSIRIRLGILIWKSYLQRRRKWKLYLCQCIISIVCYTFVIVLSTPTFRNLIVPKYETRNIHTVQDLQNMIPKNISLAYTSSNDVFDTIMKEVSVSLDQKFDRADNQSELLNDLYIKIKANSTSPFIWIIWTNNLKDFPYIWQYKIRRSAIKEQDSRSSDTYFSSGFLGIQVAINTAIINYAKTMNNEPFEFKIQEMPQTNLMYVSKVRETSCIILIFVSFAFLPFALETQALAIRETKHKLKNFLHVYNLSYYEMYIGWIWYGIMSGFPACLMGMLSILFIFRWTELILTFLFIFMYFIIMLVGMCLVSCFYQKESSSTMANVCIMLFLCTVATVMFSTAYDQRIKYTIALVHLLIPPLTFLHGLHNFAFSHVEYVTISSFGVFNRLEWLIFTWIFLSVVYFLIIVYLQYTLNEAMSDFRPWHLIFKRKKYSKKIISRIPSISDKIETTNESQGLALTVRQVTKITLNDVSLKNVSFDIFRGEYTVLTSYKAEYKALEAIISLIIGINQPDEGSINILGMDVTNNINTVTQELGYVGFCPLPQTLMPDLTVEEHMIFLLELCTVIKTSEFKWNYLTWRIDRMLDENPILKEKRNRLIRDFSLEDYGQLCWAMATITDPRIVILDFAMETLPENFKTVIYSKIKENIGKRTIIQTSVCLSHSQYANRCFMFNQGNLICAGTPRFLVSVYGQSYTLSVKLTNLGVESDLWDLVQQHVPGSQMCYKIAHLLVFHLPLHPTEPIAYICKFFDENMENLHIEFYDLLLPEMEEIHTRAVLQFHKINKDVDNIKRQNFKMSLHTVTYKDNSNFHKIYINLNVMWKKYRRFLEYYRFSWSFCFMTSILFAIYFSISTARNLNGISIISFEAEHAVDEVLLTVEAKKAPTTLVVRSDTNLKSRKVAYAYTLSEPDLTEDDVHSLRYVNLHANESMEMYLILQAISEPFQFITKFAYGLDISCNGILSLKVYYSTLHVDYAGVSRSIGRAFMSLLRYVTNTAYATIQVTDQPLSLDLSQKLLHVSFAPFVLPLLLLIIVSFVTILPSLEKGYIRITQVNSTYFSPVSYWSTLLIIDFTIYCALVVLMIIVIKIILSITVPLFGIELGGLFVLLIVYGFAAIPHAYLFSYFTRGLKSAVNYVFMNVVFLNTCGVFQRCFTPQHSLRFKSEESPGILEEVLFILLSGVLYIIILLFIEYGHAKKLIDYIFANFVYPGCKVFHNEDESVRREKQYVEETWTDLKSGIGFAVKDVYKKEYNGFQSVGGVSFAVRNSEIMTIIGCKHHGRRRLLELLAGYGCFSKGDARIFQQEIIPLRSVKYRNSIGYSAEELLCPPWLTVYESLKMIGLLRGIDVDNIYQEVNKWLSALDLDKVSKLHTHKLIKAQVIRLNLAIAMIAEPQILILDNPTRLQSNDMILDIYAILEELQTKGHSIIVGTNRMKKTTPISQKIIILSNGYLKDCDQFTNMILVRNRGYTVIFHFKAESSGLYQAQLKATLSKYFQDVNINFLQKQIANIHISDKLMTWGQLFENLEKIKTSCKSIDNYVVQHMKWQNIFTKKIESDYNEPAVSIKPFWRIFKKKTLLKCPSELLPVPLPSNLPYRAYFEDTKA